MFSKDVDTAEHRKGHPQDEVARRQERFREEAERKKDPHQVTGLPQNIESFEQHLVTTPAQVPLVTPQYTLSDVLLWQKAVDDGVDPPYVPQESIDAAIAAGIITGYPPEEGEGGGDAGDANPDLPPVDGVTGEPTGQATVQWAVKPEDTDISLTAPLTGVPVGSVFGIDTEYMTVTDIANADNPAVSRAAYGTTAAAHAEGSTVSIWVAGAARTLPKKPAKQVKFKG